jgi:hypothetical protein
MLVSLAAFRHPVLEGHTDHQLRQKSLTTGQFYMQFDPFASELTRNEEGLSGLWSDEP